MPSPHSARAPPRPAVFDHAPRAPHRRPSSTRTACQVRTRILIIFALPHSRYLYRIIVVSDNFSLGLALAKSYVCVVIDQTNHFLCTKLLISHLILSYFVFFLISG